MHAADFLHRDIAPDNIIMRADGTPVLLDFGAARRAVAEMSRALTGIVKAGYSPHEQYSSDGRLQGPWSDFYALGGTLYRAVTGRAPEEATMRVDEDRMAPAAAIAKGTIGLASSPPSTPASRSNIPSGPSPWPSCGRCCSHRHRRQNRDRSRRRGQDRTRNRRPRSG